MKTKDALVDPGHHAVLDVGSRRQVSSSNQDDKEGHLGKSKFRREKGKRKLQEASAITAQHRGGDKGVKGGGQKGKGKSGVKKQVCYAWNRDAEGCPTPCPNGRIHVCEKCGESDHKGKDCKRT